jgi:C-terminal peptidase prc
MYVPRHSAQRFCAVAFVSIVAVSAGGRDPAYAQLVGTTKLDDPILRAEVVRLIRTHYFRYIQFDTTLPADAMVASLDPHSHYVRNDSAARVRQAEMDAWFDGFGLSVIRIDGRCIINAVELQNSAGRAGLRPGDELLEVAGHAVTSLSDDSLTNFFHDRLEWAFNAEVYRKSADTTIDAWLTRNSASAFVNVKCYGMIDDSTGYIRIPNFRKGVSDEVRWALDSLATRGMRSCLIDLRYNFGGSLYETVRIEDLFVSGSTKLFSTRSQNMDFEDTYSAWMPSPYEGLPLMLLVDNDSWSAAEILAGSLQDLDRATIVGAPTAGKSLVMRTYRLSDGDDLQLATSEAVLPSGRCTQAIFHNGTYDFPPPALPVGINTHAYDSLYSQLPCRDFHTAHGRTVGEHEGIIPDIISRDTDIYPPEWYLNVLDTTSAQLLRDSSEDFCAMSLRTFMDDHQFSPRDIHRLERHLERLDTSRAKYTSTMFEPLLPFWLSYSIAWRVWGPDAAIRYLEPRVPTVRRALLEPRTRIFTGGYD